MNSKTFLILFALALIVLSFSIFGSDNTTLSSKNEYSPIGDVDWSNVKEIQIEKADASVALKNIDGKWVVANRGNYKADGSKATGLLLKLLSTQNVQVLPSTPEGIKQLGLEELSREQGAEKNDITTKVILLGASNEVLAGVLLGNMRPSTSSSGPGQYVRQFKSDRVMLLKNPVLAAARPEDWISTELVNILTNALYKVENYTNDGLIFTIKRKSDLHSKAEMKSKAEMILDAPTPEGKTLREALVTQAASGLENLGIADVYPSTAAEVADLKFDRESRFYLTNGLVYSVFTAESKENPKVALAKITVALDSKLIEELKALESVQVSFSASSSEASSSSSTSSLSSSSAPSLKFADEAEVTKLNQSFQGWIYKLPEYASGKFRKNLDEMFEAKTENAEPK